MNSKWYTEYMQSFRSGGGIMTIAETAKNVTLPQDTLRYYERIAQMQQALERLDRKIAHYEKCAVFERTLRDGETSRK